MSIDDKLAAFVSKLKWTDANSALKKKILEHTLDTLGVMFLGSGATEAQKLNAVFRNLFNEGNSSVIGNRIGAPAPSAAFLNTFYGRIHTFDDTYDPGPIHPGSPILGAALAVSEHADASGSDMLAGLLAGYEISVRLSDALGPNHYAVGFHGTGTCNAIGAAAAAARVLGLNARGVSDALGHAGSGAAGLRQYQETGSMSDSALNGARASQLGVYAALLSQGGLQAPSSILTGRWGMCNVLTQNPNISKIGSKLGSDWIWENVALKPYPTCRFTHSPISMLKNLRQKYKIDHKKILNIHIFAFRQSVEVSDRPKVKSRFDALMSHQFGAAAVLINRTVNMSMLENSFFSNSSIQELMSKIFVFHDPALDEEYPKHWSHRVRVTLIDGTILDADQTNSPGHPDFPIEHDVLIKKFQNLTNPILGEKYSEILLMNIFKLEEVKNMRSFSHFLRPD